MKTYYEVRFTLYHYNSGDGKCGPYLHQESFTNTCEATAFLDKLNHLLTNKKSTRELASEYCRGGYLCSVDGIYEITEKKL